MSGSLFDQTGQWKYLVSKGRRAFVEATLRRNEPDATFCLMLAISGARISEVPSLTPERIDHGNGTVIIETLKHRKRGVFRAIPAPDSLLTFLGQLPSPPGQKIWPWCRTTAWYHVEEVMNDAGIAEPLAKPRALRHVFGVDAGQNCVPLNIIQSWLGHARIETTTIYTNAAGAEERALAARTWRTLDNILD